MVPDTPLLRLNLRELWQFRELLVFLAWRDLKVRYRQTVLGAARMLTESDVDAAELRRRVTSPNGTTQAAIETFEAGGLRTLVAGAIHAARVRGGELSAAND